MNVRRYLSVIVVLSIVAPAVWLWPTLTLQARSAASNTVLRATLANGLRVVIVRNTLAPVASTAVNYLVGSDESPDGFPGMAHAQEHMMFRGSPGLSADQLASIGSVMGGEFNANTRESLTQYLYTVPSDDLDVALNIEALRMRGVLDAEEDWAQERGAIEQEVAQDISSPFYVLQEKLRAQLFAGTPYAHDALGTRPSFDKTSAAMLKKFYVSWYAPNNAILVIVGDVDPAATLAKVRALFGAIPRKTLPSRPNITPGAPQTAPLRLETDRPNATQIVAMRLPGLDSPDFPALEVLADILQNQRFELYNLVTEGKALTTSFDLDPLPKSGLGYVAVSFPAGGDPEAIDAALRAILARTAKNGVPAELVEAAKTQERRQAEFQKNSIAGLASIWSDAVALYGLPSPEADLARIERVTAADVNRVARTYLDVDHAISATMLPMESGGPVAGGTGFGGKETISLGEAKTTQLPTWAQAALSRLQVPTSTLHPVVSTLANGLTLIVQPESVSDTVTVSGRIRNRPEAEEPIGQEGVAQVLDRLLSYGTEHLDRVAFQKALDKIGADADAGTDFNIQVLTRDFDRGVELLADNELHPALPQAAVDTLKPPLARMIGARNQSPAYLAQRSLRAALYPPGDPILREPTAQSVLSLSRDDIKSYHDRFFRPDLTTIVVIGNIAPDRVHRVIEKYFGDWKSIGPKPQVDLLPVPPNTSAIVAVPDNSRVQDNVMLAQNLALPRSDPDYYPLSLGNAVLGGGFYATRLTVDLRKNLGLVYSVGAGIQATRTRGAYIVNFASDPQNVKRAADIASDEIRKMQTQSVGANELLRAKAILLRRIPLGESSIDDIARGLLTRSDLDLPLDEPEIAARRYISLTPADVQASFKRWMRPNDLVRVSQGPDPQ
jgi:zinc protease